VDGIFRLAPGTGASIPLPGGELGGFAATKPTPESRPPSLQGKGEKSSPLLVGGVLSLTKGEGLGEKVKREGTNF